MDDAPAPSSPLAFHSKLDWARFSVALAGTIAAAVAMASVGDVFGWVEAGLLGVAALTMPLDRVEPHVFGRAVLWGGLCTGAIAIHSMGDWQSVALFAGSGGALLALGGAGMDSTRGAFAPRVLRRTLVTMMVVGLSVAHVFFVSAVFTEMLGGDVLDPLAFELPSTVFTRVSMFVTPVLLVLGVAGLSRTKAWGLFAYLASLGGVALTIALAWSWVGDIGSHAPDMLAAAGSAFWVLVMSVLWGAGGVLALGAALPVLAALVFKQTPSKEPGRRWGRWAHGALVLCVATAALAAFAVV